MIDPFAGLAAATAAGWALHAWHLRRRLTLAEHDLVTGLPHRAAWTTPAQRLLRRWPDAAVLLVDLDHFKQLNDTYGHDAGDQALAQVADRLRALLGVGEGTAVLVRHGGDEYAAVATGLRDGVAGDAQLAYLHDALVEPVLVDGHAVSIEASIGVVRGRDLPAGRGLRDALRVADQAMYRVKQDHHAAASTATAAAVPAQRHGDHDRIAHRQEAWA